MERRIEVKIKAQPNFYQIFVYCVDESVDAKCDERTLF